jgi:hypothetical protein
MTSEFNILDWPILSLSESDQPSRSDQLLLRDLWGTLILGSSNSGKTSTVGKQLAYGLLRTPSMGGLILTAKAEETQNWIAYAKACGREKDLIVFNAESGHCFDPMHYEFTRPGRGSGDKESIIDFFTILASIGKAEYGQGSEPFWIRGTEQIQRNVLTLLDLAGEPISIASIDRVIKSLPMRPGEVDEESWQTQSYCAQLINATRKRKDSLTADQWSDLNFAMEFLCKAWPAFDERPRSSLAMTWSGMADQFLFNPLNRLFCTGKCSFSPEMTTHNSAIILCDFPMLEHGQHTGRLINAILKLTFQRAWLRRKISESPNPVFLWQDEFHYFVSKFDNFFQTTCRSSRVAVVCLTQNILNLAEELGEQQPGSKTKSFLGNLGTKIFLQQNDVETCNYAADQIGKEYSYLDSYNAGSSQRNESHSSVGGSKQLVHIVDPIAFQRLAKPTSTNPYAQGIVYRGGETFNATKSEQNPKGRNYLSVYFSRE